MNNAKQIFFFAIFLHKAREHAENFKNYKYVQIDIETDKIPHKIEPALIWSTLTHMQAPKITNQTHEYIMKNMGATCAFVFTQK